MKSDSKQFFQFLDKNKLAPDLLGLVSSEHILNQYATVFAYFENKKIQYSKEEYLLFLKKIQCELVDQIRELSLLHFYIMEKSNDFGDLDESHVRLSYCRHILQIPLDHSISFSQQLEFQEKMDSFYRDYDFSGLSPAAAKSKYINSQLLFLGKRYKMDAGNKISKLLAFLGSQYGLLSQPLWMESVSFIFGKVRKKHVQDYDVILFQNEVVRSPNFVHANPALVFQKVVYLRQEAFDAMYHQKWKPVLNPDSFVTSNIQNQPFWNISFAIKETVLSLYGIKDEASLQGSQAQFTKEMQDTILHHEWGHSVVNDRIFPYENIAIAEGMEHHPKEEIFDAFLEFMADFAPDNEGLCGPFKRMVDIAKTDTIKATRMFYMYLSDVFFYDTMDYFMFTYSDLMCLAMLRYIKPDKSIDFHLLEHDLHFNESKTGTFFEKVYKLYWEYSDGIMQIAKNATFALPSGDKNYAYVKGLCVKEAQVSNSFIKASDKLFLSIFWINIYAYLDKFAPNDYKKLLNFIEKIKKELVMKIMILSCGRKKAESYHYDHRKYIQEQFFALGFTSRFSK